MARDYAHSNKGRRPQTQQKGAMPGWVWMVFGLSIGLAVAAFIYISRPTAALQSTLTEASVVPPPVPNGKGKGSERVPLPPEEKERFTFYQDLKKQQVFVPQDERPAPVTPPPKASSPSAAAPLYLVQVASFRVADDAEREKAKLALLGLETRVEKITVDDRETYFRVRTGPMTEGRVQNTMTRLKENGMQGMVVKAP